MTMTIPNTRTPPNGYGLPFAEFRLILKRNHCGDVELEIPKPKCFRDFHNFTGVEKDAYNNLVAHIVEGAADAMLKTDAEARAKMRGGEE